MMTVSPREEESVRGACAASVLSPPCVPKLVKSSFSPAGTEELLESRPGARGLVAGAPGA